jgi:hypothetical protein
MDMSKLPRMSNTPAPPPAQPNPTSAAPAPPASPAPPPTGHLDYERRDTVGIGAGPEAWLSIAIGIILMLMSPRIFQYTMSPSRFAQNYTFTAANGAPMTYPQTVFFWGDLALTLFALVLVLEGLVIAFGRRVALVGIAFGLTMLAVAINLIYVAGMLFNGYGLQIISAMAVAFGVYIAMFEWKLLTALRAIAKVRETPPPAGSV